MINAASANKTNKAHKGFFILFNVSLEALASAVKQNRERKGTQIEKGPRWFLCTDETIVYTENLKETKQTKKKKNQPRIKVSLIGCRIKGQYENQSSLHTSNKPYTEIFKHTHTCYLQ